MERGRDCVRIAELCVELVLFPKGFPTERDHEMGGTTGGENRGCNMRVESAWNWCFFRGKHACLNTPSLQVEHT